ncbi:MAG: hypothetical protein KBC30_09390 [Planctomycetes bacterium]|nr:hypothetical protein [Planctomycetota bacterium]HNZ67131.1 hypothetical protein [Planctomycetota bacterium]HPY73979.1 hypothetical protein [Planctomycetota bacterium]HQA99602.1 hypothetical protein [Planctomycetota bacterium]
MLWGKQVKQVELCSGEVKLLQIRKETRNKMKCVMLWGDKYCSGEINIALGR